MKGPAILLRLCGAALLLLGEARVQRVKTVRKKGQPTQYLVRWLGWGPKYDSYINGAVLQNIRGGVSTQ